jgi:hypothetical protein
MGLKMWLPDTEKGITPIPFDTLWRMFKDSLKHIEKVCSLMIWDKGIKQTPEYQRAMDKIDKTWLDCMQGKAGLKEYQDTLKEWQRVVKELSNVNEIEKYFLQPIKEGMAYK